jgi:hypothetical protein
MTLNNTLSGYPPVLDHHAAADIHGTMSMSSGGGAKSGGYPA